MAQDQETLGDTEPNITSADPLLLPSVSKENLTTKLTWTNQLSGMFYSLAASCLFVSSTFVVKSLGVDLLDALVSRMTVQTLVTLSFALYKHYPLLSGTAKEIFLQICCSAAGSISFVLFYACIRYIDLSDLNTLFYTRVVWTVFLSIIIYREKPSLGLLIALPLTFLGVVFVTQPSFLFTSTTTSGNVASTQMRIFGSILAVSGALISASNVIIYKQLVSTGREIKTSVLGFQMAASVWFIVVLNQFYRRFYLKIITPLSYFISWRYLLSSAVCLFAVLGNVFMQKAMKREHPAIFSLLGSADIIVALLLQNLFTSEPSNLYAIIGSALIISSVALIGISKIINQKKADAELKAIEKKNLNNKIEKC